MGLAEGWGRVPTEDARAEGMRHRDWGLVRACVGACAGLPGGASGLGSGCGGLEWTESRPGHEGEALEPCACARGHQTWEHAH